MKVLVTGGAGFIGSALVRYMLTATEASVVNLDKLTYAAVPEALDAVAGSPRYAFHQVDIGDRAAVARVFETERPDAVMHLAAESHVDRSIDGPGDFIETNILGTFTLLQAARAYRETLTGARREDFRFHHVSTDEVFGSLAFEDPAFVETSPYCPTSPYSASKAASDHLVRAWGETYGLPVVLSNCSNNYGPWQFPDKLIPVMILKAVQGEALPVYGRGENVRDWLYVEDHATALWTVLTRGRPGESYNVGGNAELSNIEMVRRLCGLLDDRLPDGAPHDRLISFVADRPGHDLRYAIDAGKIRRELDWRPAWDLEGGLGRTVDWYLEHEAWWRAIQEAKYDGGRLGVSAAVTEKESHG